MGCVAAFAELQWLNLWHTRITDAGLEPLLALKDLKYLNLTDTKIGDAGLAAPRQNDEPGNPEPQPDQDHRRRLKQLSHLAHLKSLTLVQTEVTAEGAKRLQHALPKCKVKQLSNFDRLAAHRGQLADVFNASRTSGVSRPTARPCRSQAARSINSSKSAAASSRRRSRTPSVPFAQHGAST